MISFNSDNFRVISASATDKKAFEEIKKALDEGFEIKGAYTTHAGNNGIVLLVKNSK